MHDFRYKRGTLCCEAVRLERVVSEVGTPVYVYSLATLRGNYHRLDRAFASISHLICYSVKSCSNIAICKALVREGAGLDIVSEGELRRGLRAGAQPRKIVFAGVGKTDEEIAYALKKGILFFSVESFAELDAIGRVADRLRRKARIAVRVTPNIDARTHRYITTGKIGNKFGLDMESARAAYKRAMEMENVNPIAVQMHIGSQITETEPYVRAIRRLRPLVRQLREMGVPLAYLDIGGGLGIVYREETPATARKFAAAVLPEVKGLGLDLILEPGRFIAGNAGILLTRVIYIKRVCGKNFIIVDAGMNDLIRPSLYNAYHEIVPLRRGAGKRIVADVVGPVCESGDFFARDRELQEPRQGDILALMGGGAYCFSMSSNYNSRRRAAEVLVHGRSFDLIRERESYVDLMRGERIPEFLK